MFEKFYLPLCIEVDKRLTVSLLWDTQWQAHLTDISQVSAWISEMNCEYLYYLLLDYYLHFWCYNHNVLTVAAFIKYWLIFDNLQAEHFSLLVLVLLFFKLVFHFVYAASLHPWVKWLQFSEFPRWNCVTNINVCLLIFSSYFSGFFISLSKMSCVFWISKMKPFDEY